MNLFLPRSPASFLLRLRSSSTSALSLNSAGVMSSACVWDSDDVGGQHHHSNGYGGASVLYVEDVSETQAVGRVV